MQSNHVKRVTIRVELDNGDVIEMHEDKPAPSGGNPRFIHRQASTGIDNVAHRIDMAIVGAYGKVPSAS